MTNELREAEKRRRSGPYPESCKFGEYWMPEQEFNDMETLADAYLAEHPPDDDTPIDRAAMTEVGFRQATPSGDIFDLDGMAGSLVLGPSLLVTERYAVWVVGGVDVAVVRTKGQLKRLVGSLEIELKE